MAGGRRAKRTAKRETKSKRIQNALKEKATTGEELKDEQSTAAKIVSEKDKCIPQDAIKQKGDSSVEASSLPSKYVPPFSRTSKNSSKSEEKSLTRSQSTRKRRNEGSSSVESEPETTKTVEAAYKETEFINVENCPSTSKLKVEDYNSQTSQNNIKEDGEDIFIHPNKQPKLSKMDDTDHKSQPTNNELETSAANCDEDKLISEKVVQNSLSEKDLKGIAIVEEFIEKVKHERCSAGSSESLCESNEETPTNAENLVNEATLINNVAEQDDADVCTDLPEEYVIDNSEPQLENLSPIDDLIKACVTHLVEKVEELDVTGVESVEKKTSSSEEPTQGQVILQEHNDESSIPTENHQTLNNSNGNKEEITNQSSQTKLTEMKETENDTQLHVSEQINEVKQNTDINKQQSSDVTDMEDLEFLMDCTDSQLIGDEVLEQSYSCTSDENYRAKAPESITDIPERAASVVATVTDKDHELEDGAFLVQEITKEITSLKSYLAMMWKKYEQIQKRNGPS